MEPPVAPAYAASKTSVPAAVMWPASEKSVPSAENTAVQFRAEDLASFFTRRTAVMLFLSDATSTETTSSASSAAAPAGSTEASPAGSVTRLQTGAGAAVLAEATPAEAIATIRPSARAGRRRADTKDSRSERASWLPEEFGVRR